MTAGYASSTDAWKRNHPDEEQDVVAELRAEVEDWKAATGDPTPEHARATTTDIAASMNELARQRDEWQVKHAALREAVANLAEDVGADVRSYAGDRAGDRAEESVKAHMALLTEGTE